MQMMMFESIGKKEQVGLADCQPAKTTSRTAETVAKPRAVDMPAKRQGERHDEEAERWDGLY